MKLKPSKPESASSVVQSTFFTIYLCMEYRQIPSSGPMSSPAASSSLPTVSRMPFRHVTTARPKPARAASSKHSVSEPSYPVRFPIYPMPANIQIPVPQQSLIPTHQDIVLKKYATSVDERNFLTVYEYMINDQWIIWDYYTGYVHLTGLWKAIGHSKADIVKLLDNSPDLEPVIRRVRGGFLKIQGTWVPFEIARALASRTCYFIRYALIPIFGEAFPDSCLRPHEPGFGQLQLTLVDPKRRKKRTSVSEFQKAHSGGENAIRKRRKSEVSVSPRSVPSNVFGSSSLGVSASSSSSSSPSIIGSPTFHNVYGTDSTIPIPQARHPSIASTLLNSPPFRGQHQSSRSLGGNDSGIFDRIHTISSPRYFDIPQSRRDTTGSLSSSRSDGVLSSSEEDDEPLDSFAIDSRRRRLSHPPPMPEKIVFPDEVSLVQSPDEFLEILQATRSLQQISTGAAAKSWTNFGGNLGGDFECGGKIWQWDGRKELNIKGLSPSPASVIPPVVTTQQFTTGSLSSNREQQEQHNKQDKHNKQPYSRGIMDINGLLS